MSDDTPSARPRSATFGRYRLVGLLGSGGMGVVYRAVLPGPGGLERSVVIKRLLPQFSGDPSHARMMANEAKLVSQLKHPGIVQLFEFGQAEGEHFLAMELVEGLDLTRVLRALAERGERLPVELACLAGLRLAEALGYAHGLGIIHRDLSPTNVMATRTGQVKLLDFGIARDAGLKFGQDRTQTGALKGKLTYMAPEQLEGARADARSDLFSLGVVLHELLSGRRLFRAEGELAVLRLRRELTAAPDISDARPDVPPPVAAALAAMLAWEPAARPTSGEAVAECLRPFAGTEAQLGALVVRLTPNADDRPVTASFIPPQNTATSEPSAMTSTRPAARRAWLGWALAATGLVGALGWLGLRLRNAPKQAEPPAPSAPASPREEPATPFSTPQPTPQPTPTVAPTVAPTRLPPDIVVQVHGPTGALVTLDGVPRGTLPLEVRLPRRSAERKVRVSRAGYEPYAVGIPGDADSTLEVVLRKRARPVTPSPAAPRREEVSDPFR